MVAQRRQIRIDAEEDAAADVFFDHPFNMKQRLIELVEVAMNHRAREVNDRRRRRGEWFHQLQPLAPVAARPSLSERVQERRAIQRQAPARLLCDDRRRLFISAERLI